MAITQIKGSNIEDGTVVAADVADDAVTTDKILDNAVTGTKIQMGSDATGDIITYNGSNYIRLARGTASQVLKVNTGGTNIEWGTDAGGIAVPGSSVRGDTLYHNGTVYTRLAKGSSGQVLTMGANDPAWAATAAGGKVLQHKETRYRTTHSTTAQWPNDNTIPQNTEGLTVTELAITPESATSTLYIDYWVTFARSVNDMGSMALFVDSTASAVAVSSAQGNTNMHTMFGNYSVVSASTSARTYKLRAAASPGGAGNLYINMAHSSANWWGAGTIPNCGIRIFELEA